jgi:hypothetical protein
VTSVDDKGRLFARPEVALYESSVPRRCVRRAGVYFLRVSRISSIHSSCPF